MTASHALHFIPPSRRRGHVGIDQRFPKYADTRIITTHVNSLFLYTMMTRPPRSLILLFILSFHTAATLADSNASSGTTTPSTTNRIEHDIKHGVEVGIHGVDHGMKVVTGGIEKGAKATEHGIAHGVQATSRVVGKVTKKIGITSNSTSAPTTAKP